MPIRELISAYGQPIIAGLTPYTVTRVANPLISPDWAPDRDHERLAAYQDFEALIENRASDVFESLQLRADQKVKISLAVALPELLCNAWADAVWSDPPTIELPSDAAQDAWDAIDDRHDFTEIGAWESVFAAAFRGTSIIRLFKDDEGRTSLEEIDPAIYFPKLRKGSDRIVESVELAWEEDRADPGAEQRQIWHVRELHAIERGSYTITYQERRAGRSVGEWRESREPEAVDGIDFLPFVELHGARWSGRYWGVSELSRAWTLFDEVDHTLSNIAEILDYHGKPLLQVPASAIYGGVFTKGADRALGIRRPEEANVARYITFDGQIDAQLANLDKIVELIMLTAEIPRTYFGLGLEGGAPSGTSLKLQLQNYLKKAGRWQSRETRRLKTLIDYALRIDGVTDEAARIASISHGSPLPVDDEQEARIESSLVMAKLSSRRTSIRKLRRVPADEIDDELQAIDDDQPEPLPAPIPPGSGAPDDPVVE